jgi:hypothetical protein
MVRKNNKMITNSISFRLRVEVYRQFLSSRKFEGDVVDEGFETLA